jgi:hypothetical protein
VDLPTGGEVAVVSAGGRCDDPEAGIGVSIRPFAPVPVEKVPRLPDQDIGFVPLDHRSAAAAPIRGHPHQLYRQPVRLTPCPTYGERLRNGAGTIVSRTYVLNCDAIPVIAPETSVVFEMVLDIPADVPAGRAELVWRLNPPNGSPRSARVMIAAIDH